MDDLIPFLIFIIIALVNLVKTIVEKGAKDKVPKDPDAQPSKSGPRSIEEFFEDIAQKFDANPRPDRMPDIPEGFQRPDYRREMEEFAAGKPSRPFQRAPEQPVPPPVPEAVEIEEVMPAMPVIAPVVSLSRTSTVTAPHIQTPRSPMIDNYGMRVPTPPMLRSAAGRNDYNLKGRKNLRRALIADIIFSPPRAYEKSFENTIIK